MVYKFTYSGCNSSYIGQTVRNLIRSGDEQRKEEAPVGQLLLECNKEVCGTAELKSEIIDQTTNTQKLFRLEALHIWRERPKINTRMISGVRELTLKSKYIYNMAKFQKIDMSESKIFSNQTFITMNEQKT